MNASKTTLRAQGTSIFRRVGSTALATLMLLVLFEQTVWAGAGLTSGSQRDLLETNRPSLGLSTMLWRDSLADVNRMAETTPKQNAVAAIELPAATIPGSIPAQWERITAMPIGPNPGKGYLRLPGHVLSALVKATPGASDAPPPFSPFAFAAGEPMTLTLVLKRDDPAGFDHYLKEVYDPKSKHYRQFLSQARIVERFGPSRNAYDSTLRYLRNNGFELVEASKNRMTLTVRAARNKVEQAFRLQLDNYRIGDQIFYANDRDPALPVQIATHVESIGGLTDLAKPYIKVGSLYKGIKSANDCVKDTSAANAGNIFACSLAYAFLAIINDLFCIASVGLASALSGCTLLNPTSASPPPGGNAALASRAQKSRTAVSSTTPIDGTGQKIGLLQFDAFRTADIADFLSLVGLPAANISQLSEVKVGGGAAIGVDESEVLLDIDTVMALAPGAQVVVYDSPFSGAGASFQPLLNAMINDHVTVISNSWAYCEDQTTLADVQSIESILQTAAASGISVFTASGDSGSTCLDGRSNTVTVPASSPSVTAVGGSSAEISAGFTYQRETWWDGNSSNPPTGQGGFGVSRFFARPGYQNGINVSAMRSIPDVVAAADPAANGIPICQADAGGCPSGLLYGGASFSTPQWAAFAALLNQAHGTNVGAFNPLIYPLANSNAFHSAASMASDFAHVGLGSPNLSVLNLALNGTATGTVDPALSNIGVFPRNPPADGTTASSVVVQLRGGNGSAVSGKAVRLTPNGSSNASITPSEGISTVNNGTVVFTVTDLQAETLTFTATDTTDGIVLLQTPSVVFGVPPAAGAGLNVFPNTVAADGVSTSSITVTLRDTLNRPTPGKLINIEQGVGRSIISGPLPPVTDANGAIRFTVADTFNETVTYSAVDVSDRSLPVPGSGAVTFNNSPGNGCGAAPVAGDGFLITPFATGFVGRAFNFGNINSPCVGPANVAFDAAGSVYVPDSPTGKIYRFGTTGGSADAAHVVNAIPLHPGTQSVAIGRDGRLYATQSATTGDFFTGAVVELDPVSGALLRTVAANITCAHGLAVDPISGDLFVDDGCAGSGSENPSIWRIGSPASATPPVSAYATTPFIPNAPMFFAPDGTLFAWSGGNLLRITGTNAPQPAVITSLPGAQFTGNGLAVGRATAAGAVQSVFMTTAGGISEVDVKTNPISVSRLVVDHIGGGNGEMTRGPDGCIYVSSDVNLLRLTDAAGTCGYTAAATAPVLSVSPGSIKPNPAQGSSQTFTATPHFGSIAAGTPILFTVAGVNPQVKMIRADASGQAAFSYAAINAGNDTLTASANVSGTRVSSPPVRVTWASGLHSSFLTLNPSPIGGFANQAITVIASLSDLSASPVASLSGQTIGFTLGSGSNCTAITDSSGRASCALTPGPAGNDTLTATFSATSQYLASTAAVGFGVMAVPAATPAATVTLSATPLTITLGQPTTLTWSSTNATACTASGGWTGSRATSGSESATPIATGTTNYTLTCTGVGGSGNATTPVTVNVAATPLPPVEVRGKGGAFGWPMLLLFGIAAALRRRRYRQGLRAVTLVGAALGVCLGTARADDASDQGQRLYAGVRVGSFKLDVDSGRTTGVLWNRAITCRRGPTNAAWRAQSISAIASCRW